MKTHVQAGQPKLKLLLIILLVAFSAGTSGTSWAQSILNITTPNTAITQDFNTLATTGTTNSRTAPAANSVIFTAQGWNYNERIISSNTAGDNNYAADNGSTATANTYSYGSTSSTDRALGFLDATNNITIVGFKFTNNTGATITSVTIGYTGEEWRTATSSHTVSFQYFAGNTDISSSNVTWSSAPALDFTTPVVAATTAALDGNAAANRTVINATFNINIPTGTTYTLRWIDNSPSGSAGGVGIDDFSLMLNVVKQNQTILFSSFAAKTTSDTLFTTSASASSGLALSYTSSNPAVATVSTTNDTVQIRGVGTTIITASQGGDPNYNAATPVSQTLTVTQGTDLLAGWDFQTTTNGGTKVLAAPNTPTVYVANTGSGTIYLNGTNGSNAWMTTGSEGTNELNGFMGTPYNAITPFTTVITGAASLALTNKTANGKSIIFKFDMSTHKNLVVSYATQGTSTGFSTQKWEYSTNATSWSTVQIITSIPQSFGTITLPVITGLDLSANAYLRLTVTGATGNLGNNRLDNIRLNAGVSPAFTTQPSNASFCAGTASASTFTVAASGAPSPTYQWQFSATGAANSFANVANGTPAGFSYSTSTNSVTIPTTSTLTVTTSAASGLYYYRAVATNTSGTPNSNNARLTINPLPLATIGGATTICQNDPQPAITFTGSGGTTPYTFMYSVNGGTNQTVSTTSGNSVTVLQPTGAAGTFTYTLLSVKDNSSTQCSNSISSQSTAITINPQPMIGNRTSTASCNGSFSVTPANGSGDIVPTGTTYSWGTPAMSTGISGGVAGSGTSVTGTLTNAADVSGTATYTVTPISGSCVGASFTVTVTVKAVSNITNKVAAICSGNSFTITPVTNGTDIVPTGTTYSWSAPTYSSAGISGGAAGSGQVSISGTLSNSDITSGTATYLVVPVSGSGCKANSNFTVAVTVNAVPKADFLQPAFSTCFGTVVQLNISGSANSTVTYHIGSSSTDYTVSLDGSGNGYIPTSSTLNPGTTIFTIVGVQINNTTCSAVLNNSTAVTVDAKPTLTLTSGSGTDGQTLCGYGYAPVTYTVSGGSSVAATVTITPSGAGVTGTYDPTTHKITISGTPTQATTYNYTVTTTGNGSCTADTKMGFITVSPYTWKGTFSSVWTNDGNWSCGAPIDGASVIISPTAQNYPVLAGETTIIGDLVINMNTITSLPGTVTINPGSTLQVNGVISGGGTITGSASSNLTTGSTGTVHFTQTTPGTTNVLQNLKVNSGTLTLGDALNITAGGMPGVVTVSGNGQLVTGGNLTLKSDAAGTAAVGTYTGTGHPTDYISGDVVSEPYTDGGNPTTGKRAWRLITSPVTGQSIHDAWQEGLVYNSQSQVQQPSTYGTIITGEKLSPTDANNRGFDYVGGGNNTSIKQYDSIAGAWVPLSTNVSTGTRIPLHSHQAYLLFIRGDRTKNTTTAKGVDNLRATGTLLQGTQTVLVPAASTFTLVGNPYAAPLNFAQVYAANQSVIQDEFYAWDTKLSDFGGYVTVSSDDGVNYAVIPSPIDQSGSTSITQYIQSGQGFFVIPNNGGTLSIQEDMKNTGESSNVSSSPFREVPVKDKRLWVNLYQKDNDTTSHLSDGFLARFDATYSPAINENDSRKLTNINENFGIASQGSNLIIESRPDVKATDTLYIKMSNVTKRAYQIKMKADNFNSAGTQAWLVDNYLGTKQAVSLSGDIATVNFSVTTDSLSAKSDRFLIVFQNNAVVLPVTLTSIKATPANGGVNVSWTVTNEVNIKGYTIEKSTDGGRTYSSIGTQAAKNNTASPVSSYSGFDALPKTGDNLYRIRIEGKDGSISYSSVATVSINVAGGKIEITLYPNPVRNGKVNLQLSNLTEGTYLASVYSEGGQSVYQKKITIGQPNITQSEELKLGNSLASGSYQFIVSDHKGIILFTSQLVIAK